MNVSQMLHHLNLACGGSLGFYTLPDESYLVSRTVFRWILIDSLPEQPVGLRSPKDFKIPRDAQFDFDFRKATGAENPGCCVECEIGCRLAAASHVWNNDAGRMGRAPSNPYRNHLQQFAA